MANEELMDKIMSDEELEQVAGGRGYVYLTKREDGKYNIVSANKKLTADQAKGLLTGKVPAQAGINENVVFNVMKGVSADKLDIVKSKLNKIYKGCDFVDLE